MAKEFCVYLNEHQIKGLKMIKSDFYKGTVSSVVREGVDLILALYTAKRMSPEKTSFKVAVGTGLLKEESTN